MFHLFVRDDECIVVWTVFLFWGGFMSSSLQIIVIGYLHRTWFGVTWLFLLHRWVHIVVVAFGVDWGVDFSSAVIAIFTVAGLRAVPAPSFWLLSGGFILRCVLFVAVILLRCVHHVYII